MEGLSLKTTVPALTIVLLLSACVVRTHGYHCTLTLPDGSQQEIDIEMSPTDLRLGPQSFSFVEEIGVERVYRSPRGDLLRFNAASNQLQMGEHRWACRRY